MIEYIVALSMHVGMGDDYNSIHPRIQWNQDNMLSGHTYTGGKIYALEINDSK